MEISRLYLDPNSQRETTIGLNERPLCTRVRLNMILKIIFNNKMEIFREEERLRKQANNRTFLSVRRGMILKRDVENKHTNFYKKTNAHLKLQLESPGYLRNYNKRRYIGESFSLLSTTICHPGKIA